MIKRLTKKRQTIKPLIKMTALTLLLGITSFTISITVSAKASANQWPVTSPSDIELAKQFNDYLNTGKIDAAQTMISPQVEFSDPTWGAYRKDKAHMIQAFDPKLTAGYHNMQYRIRNIFTSKGTVVIHMIASADVAAGGSADHSKWVHTVIDLIRVIEIKDNKVVRQIDLADYDRVMPALAQAVK